MTAWHEIEVQEPEFAGRVQRIFDAHLHKTMATLRRDGAPRISGTEATFRAGHIWLGTGRASRKALDLFHDPRVAVHCATVDTELVEGDAKVSGRAVEETDSAVIEAVFEGIPPDAVFFWLDIDEVVITRVENAERMVVESWRPGQGLRMHYPV